MLRKKETKQYHLTLNLTDKEYRELTEEAKKCHMTVEAFLEEFIAERAGGNHRYDSLDRETLWYYRCGFSWLRTKNLLSYLCAEDHGYPTVTGFIETYENLADLHVDADEQKLMLDHIEEEYDKYYREEYSTLAEFKDAMELNLEEMLESIEFKEGDLREIEESFASYMDGAPYDWESECREVRDWYYAKIM